MAALRDTTVTLPDGRRLAYTEWGVADGKPVMLFHGRPGSRLWCYDEEVTTAENVRLLIPDRPGTGRSDPLEPRSLADWPADAAALANALGIGKFAVVGVSAGGPYALACAALIPDRLTAVADVSSGIAEFDWAEHPDVMERWLPRLRTRHEAGLRDPAEAARLSAEAWNVLQDAWTPEATREEMESVEGDRWYFNDPGHVAIWNEMILEWSRQGADGVKWDLADLFLPWGFRLSEISLPVTVFHGLQDAIVSLEDAEFEVATLPYATLVTWPDAGHLGCVKHWREVLQAVA